MAIPQPNITPAQSKKTALKPVPTGNNLKNYLFGYCRNLKGPVKLKSPDVYRWDKRYIKFTKVSPTPAA